MSTIVLVTVTGPDGPGISFDLATLVDQHGAELLDLSQSTIHQSLNLGMLVRIPEGDGSSPIIKDLLFAAHDRGLQANFRPISVDGYEEWVESQGKRRHIITLLGPKLGAESVALIGAISQRHGLNIDRITRLSGRVSLRNPPSSPRACVEFSVRGTPSNLEALKAELFVAAQTVAADVAVQVDDIYRRNRRLFAFDMDSTLIQTEVIDELAQLNGVGEQVRAITAAAMNGEIDFNESLRRRVGLLQGLSESALDEVADALPLSDGAERLMSVLKSLGYKTAILSGGFDYFAKRLQSQLGFDHVVANRLEIVDGKLTGKVLGRIVDGAHKAESLAELVRREGLCMQQVIAVGDGANDLQMLAAAGLGIAFHAKPSVRAEADHAISTLGLDGLLYLIGMRDRDVSSINSKGLDFVGQP